MARPLPQAWNEIIKNNVPFYRLLSPALKKDLHGLIQVFINEKTFEGCGGLTLNDEIKVTIAAQACILLLGREGELYPTLRTILVYPHAYLAPVKQRMANGIVLEGVQHRLGESWSRGQVVLAWDEILRDSHDIHDGHNLVFHEFAHQLDNESGSLDGVPELDKRSSYIVWARVLGTAYQKLIRDITYDRHPLLDQYGATNPAEFFAVVTELYFEKPYQLKKYYPDLYEQFRLFYKIDPASFR